MKRLKTYLKEIWDNWYIITAWILALMGMVAENTVGVALGVFFAVLHYGEKKSVNHLTINVKSNVDSEWTVSTEPANEKVSP